MVSDLKAITTKGCKIAGEKKMANFARIRRLHNKDQGVIQQGSGGYSTMIRRLYNKDLEVMFSDAIIESLQKTFAH